MPANDQTMDGVRAVLTRSLQLGNRGGALERSTPLLGNLPELDSMAVVHVLDPASWRWTRRAPAPGNRTVPGPQLSTGTYGRFRYVPALDLFVVMNGVQRNVFVYRLAPL